ncbi:RNA polymerase sigma-70 factor (ECF subfamily) [Algoriphagus sp. 4150]|uniref:RNA polymerase sigma-70 factor n=1 Tax=Algoriphagus sp. 4150 TaxID=2817756 RepID=UPI00285B92DB|nr:RNA polymerase sigma-70 factor [Algoriphagus sp. 4150]MDR7129531.1 RNA polymerase sigma-70 factor (ECF subfamily) [Algoriphagus sp. 4150]
MFYSKLNIDFQPKLDIRTQKGFEQAYNLYAEKMYGICRSKINSSEVAEEIVHDIFRSLWERRHLVEVSENIEHYLTKATKLKIIDHYRQKARDEKHLACALEEYCEAENRTEHDVELADLQSQVDFLVDRLPCKCRDVFRLSREKGLSNQEIASALLISEKTVEYHIAKALKYLKERLTEYKL